MLETDPVSWARTADGDLEIPIRWTRGLEAVEQGVRSRILLVRGEWFADLDAGVPWLPTDSVDERRALLGNRFNRERALADFRAAILDTPGVTEILSLSVDFDRATRILHVAWRTRTVWGDTPLDTLDQEVS